MSTPGQENEGNILGPSQAGERIEYAASSIIGHVPRSDRVRWTSALDGYKPDQLKEAFAGWFAASGEGRDAFRGLLLQPWTPDKVGDELRAAARDVVGARNQDELDQGAAALLSPPSIPA